MKCVIIGDIGWENFYHLGDEAMTESAIDLLRERGITDITLVSAQPEVSEAFYGVPCVSRIGFTGKHSYAEHISRLEKVDAVCKEEKLPDHSVYAALKSADLAVIAGGGNLNSDFPHHVYERLAFARIAHHFDVPLFVSSQTVGPNLRDTEQQGVQEILDISLAFGARESSTFELLMKHFTGAEGKVSHTLDDAILLRPTPQDYDYVGALIPHSRIAIASFTSHPGTSGLSKHQYQERLASLVDAVALRHDLDVYLTPHTGSLREASPKTHDRLSNERIAELSTSGRVHELPLLTAKQTVALTERSALSLSTRYHPTVFGSQARIPTVAIALSYYSSLRMNGSLSNVGCSAFVVPSDWWNGIAGVVDTALKHQLVYTSHLNDILPALLQFQHAWWDSIVTAAESATWPSPGHVPDVSQVPIDSVAINTNSLIKPFTDMTSLERLSHANTRADEKVASQKVTQLQAKLSTSLAREATLSARIHQAENRKVVRLVDGIADIFRRGGRTR